MKINFSPCLLPYLKTISPLLTCTCFIDFIIINFSDYVSFDKY